MPFTVFQKPTTKGRLVTTEPRVTMRRGDNGTTVSLNKPLMVALKWIKGDKVEVLVGTGEDAGYIALRRAADGYTLASDGDSHRCKIAAKALLPGGRISSCECSYQEVDGVLYVETPAAFRSERPIPTRPVNKTNSAMVAA